MRIDWDEQKNRRNQAKHKVSFELAQHVFDDPYHVSIQDRQEHDEERWQTLGMIGKVVVLLVAHTYQEKSCGEAARIISARKATKHERRFYEESIQ